MCVLVSNFAGLFVCFVALVWQSWFCIKLLILNYIWSCNSIWFSLFLGYGVLVYTCLNLLIFPYLYGDRPVLKIFSKFINKLTSKKKNPHKCLTPPSLIFLVYLLWLRGRRKEWIYSPRKCLGLRPWRRRESINRFQRH